MPYIIFHLYIIIGMKISKLTLAGLLAYVIPLSMLGQQKPFTFSQLFDQQYPAISRSLPWIEEWADDRHYIEIVPNTRENEKPTLLSVNARTGKASPYVKPITSPVVTASLLHGAAKNIHNITNSPDSRWLAYTKNNDLYVLELSTGRESRLTTDGSDSIMNGYASWVYYEEIFGRSSDYKAFWWSPNSKYIAFMRFDDSRVPVFPIYVPEGRHGSLENHRYPKAGDENPEVMLGIFSLEDTATTWANFDPAADQYFGKPIWTPDNQLWTPWINRGQDSLIIYQINTLTGRKKMVYSEKQSTWVTLGEEDRIRFLSSGNEFLVKSDKDGWENLYLYDKNGIFINQVTSGNFWGTEILTVNEKTREIFIRARKDHSERYDIYKASLDGKEQIKISQGDYSHENVVVSPSGKFFITTYSNLKTPPTMAVINDKGKIIREIASSKGPDFDSYAKPKSALIRVRSADDEFDLPVIITYPIGFDSTKQYPVLINVYGGPNAGTVFDQWKAPIGSLQWLAQEGMVQVSMDNRSSGHFGKRGLNYIYQEMGKWEIEDFMTCGKWIRSQPWADTTRIAIMGGSFGGYMACMGLTYGADVFTHGIASFPVTNWELYDTHYTERYMGKPEENPEGYRMTSVMTYANRYKGLLRIIHGSADENVHMQNTMQLADALQDLNKHFELMIYPGQRHGITGDKRAHYQLENFRFIYQNLLNKPLPEDFQE